MAILGYNTIGGTQDYYSDYLTLCKFTPTEDGTITSISSYSFKDYGGTANIRFAVYSDNGGVPDQLRAYTNANTLVTSTAAWYTGSSFTEAVTNGLEIQNGVPIWLAVMNDDPYTVAAYIDTGSSNQLYLENPAFTNWNWKANLTTPNNQFALVISLYANYTPASIPVSKIPSTYIGGTYIGGTWLVYEQGAISGVFYGTSDLTGTLKGKGLISATFSGTSSSSAILRGKVQISSTYSGTATFSATGNLNGKLSATYSGTSDFILYASNTIRATYSGTSDFAATIKGKCNIVANYSGQSLFDATIMAKGNMNAAYFGQSTFAGSISAYTSISSTFAGQSNFTGTLTEYQPKRRFYYTT